jgi:hypothetical protein
MEQRLGSLLIEIRELVKAGLEEMRATAKASQEMIEANQEKLQAKMEVNLEKAEAMAEHYKWVPRIKATQLLTALQARLLMFYTGFSKKQRMRRPSGFLRTDLGSSTWLHHIAISCKQQPNPLVSQYSSLPWPSNS